MAITIEQVPVWAIDCDGIGHAVTYRKPPYLGTVCDTFANWDVAKERPSRICQKCIAGFAKITAPKEPT